MRGLTLILLAFVSMLYAVSAQAQSNPFNQVMQGLGQAIDQTQKQQQVQKQQPSAIQESASTANIFCFKSTFNDRGADLPEGQYTRVCVPNSNILKDAPF